MTVQGVAAISRDPFSFVRSGEPYNLSNVATTPATLHYAHQPPKWFRRRHVQRWIWRVLAAALAPVIVWLALLGIQWARKAWLTHENLVAIEACASYESPVGQLVFEMQGKRITTLATAPPWGDWWTPSKQYPTIFLHRLSDRSPTQILPPSQLVAVEIDPRLMYSYDGRTILDRQLICFSPKQVWNAATSPNVGMVLGSTQLVVLPQEGDHIRVYAGHVAAEDPTAFSFDVEYNGQRQTIRGYVKANLVILEPQAGETFTGTGWTPCLFWSPAGASAKQEQKSREAAASTGQPGVTVWPLPSWWTGASATSQPALFSQ